MTELSSVNEESVSNGNQAILSPIQSNDKQSATKRRKYRRPSRRKRSRKTQQLRDELQSEVENVSKSKGKNKKKNNKKKPASRKQRGRGRPQKYFPDENGNYVCPKPNCGKMYPHVNSLQRHIRSHDVDKNDDTFKCELPLVNGHGICPYSTWNEGYFKQHQKVHKLQLLQKTNIVEFKKKAYSCSACKGYHIYYNDKKRCIQKHEKKRRQQ